MDAESTVHLYFKLHREATLMMGKGEIVLISWKNLNMNSSMETELVGSDDASSLILWTKLFLEYQG